MTHRPLLTTLLLTLASTGCIIEVCDTGTHSGTTGDTGVDIPIPDCTEVLDVERISEDTTITADCVTEVAQFITVRDDAVLTIEAGARLEFAADGGMHIERARLVIDGTAQRPVVLTSGDPQLPGAWSAITFAADTLRGNTIRHAIFEYGGAPRGAYENHGVLSLAWVTGYEPGTFVLENTVFRHNLYGGVGVWSLSGSQPPPGAFTSFSGNTFIDNGPLSIRLPIWLIGDIGADNSVDTPVHVATRNLYTNMTWPDLGQPYVLESGIRLADVDAELHVDGMELRFDRRQTLEVDHGALFAQDVTFTSAAPTPQAGDWSGMRVNFQARGTRIEDSHIEYAGTADYATLAFQNDSALYSVVTGTTFADNVGAANLQAQEYCGRFTGAEAGNTFDLTACVQ